MRRALLVLVLLGCSMPAPGSVDPATRSLAVTVDGDRAAALSALSAVAMDLGLTVADASVDGGFWRSARSRMPGSDRMPFVIAAGALGLDLELDAALENVGADSVRVTVAGTYGFLGGSESSRRYLEGRFPVTRAQAPAWAYVDSLAAGARRRLR